MSTQTKLTTIHFRQFGIIAGFLFMMFFVSITTSFAATTATLYGTNDGNYTQWTPKSGATHYTQVDETTCNGTTDYVSETTTGERDSYGISLSSVPNGATITNIAITPCASRNSNGGGSATLDVFYRYNGTNSADAGAYALTGTTPVALSTTNFSGLSIVKAGTDTFEIGAIYSAGTKGARLSRLVTVITYTPAPPTVTTDTASSVAITTATLNGTANPNSTSATGWFRYATTNPGTCDDTFGTRAPLSGGDALGTGSSNVAYSEIVSGLTEVTTYYYCAVGSNVGGTGVGSVQSFTTLAGTLPSAPTGATASNVSGTQNDISWTDASSNEAGFKVERLTNGSFPYVQIATTSANATSYSDTSASADNTYKYRVRAYNVIGNSAYSTSNDVITATVVPNDPTTLASFVASSTTAFLYWSHTGNNEDGFKIERSTDNVNFSVIETVDRDVTTTADYSLPTGTYYYRVYAYNAVGNSGYSNTETVIIP